MGPCRSTIRGLVHPTGVAVTPCRSRGRDKHRVGVAGMHENPVDVVGFRQPHEVPRHPSVQAPEHTPAARVAVARIAFACSHPDQIRIQRTQRHGADALGGLVVEDGFPCDPCTGALPQAARGRAHKNDVGLIVRHGDGGDSAAHGAGTNVSDIHRLDQRFHRINGRLLRVDTLRQAQKKKRWQRAGKSALANGSEEREVGHGRKFMVWSWVSGKEKDKPKAFPFTTPSAFTGSRPPRNKVSTSFFRT